MRPRTALFALGVLAAAALGVGLGFWQLGRLEQKRELNRLRREALAAPATPFASMAAADLLGRRVELKGRYDPRFQVLLSARFHLGEPGVEVVTPLELEGGGAVLVNRGWLASQDAVTARPQDFPEPGPQLVVGVAEPIGRGTRGSAIRVIQTDSLTLLSTHELDLDSLAVGLPFTVAPLVVRQLPGPGVPDQPVRVAPAPLDESIHLGYAIQWFAITAILLGGSAWLAWSRRRGARTSIRPGL